MSTGLMEHRRSEAPIAVGRGDTSLLGLPHFSTFACTPDLRTNIMFSPCIGSGPVGWTESCDVWTSTAALARNLPDLRTGMSFHTRGPDLFIFPRKVYSFG